MDFKSYLRKLVLLPKKNTEESKTEYDYPEKAIACLNSIRDHYTRFHTTFAIFYPSSANTSLLTIDGGIPSLETATNLFTNSFPAPNTPFQSDIDFPVNLRNFLITTTLGFTVNAQAMVSTQGKRYIGSQSDRQAIVNRIADKGTTSTVLVAGQNTTVIKPPLWWSELNGTDILSTSTVPTGDEVIAIINEVLAEAYSYYAIDPVLPIFGGEDISLTAPSPYWVSSVARKIPLSKVSSTYAETTLSETYYANYSNRQLVKGMIENGTGLKKDRVTASDFYSTFYGFSPVPANYLNSFPIDDTFVTSFKAIFGDWFEFREMDVSDKFYPDMIRNANLSPMLTTEENIGTGDLYTFDQSNTAVLLGTVNYYLKSNFLVVKMQTSGQIVPSFSLWNYNNFSTPYIQIIRTTKQKIPFNKITNLMAPTSNYAGSNGLSTGESMSWILNLLIKARMISKNSWLNTNVDVSPYVKFFTAGKVTLQYLQAIQVRDTILKSERGSDLYLFPAFLIYSPSLLTEDPYSPLNFRVDSTTIKKQLASAITYIVNQLFAQDIATLNTISSRFDQSISVNNSAKEKLRLENEKMKQLESDLTSKLLEAKKLFTTLEILKSNLASLPDPVLAYNEKIKLQMDNELAAFTNAEKLRLAAIAESKRLADALEAQRQLEMLEAKRIADLAEAKRILDLAEEQRLKDLAAAQLIADAEAAKAAEAELLRLREIAEVKRVNDINEMIKQNAFIESQKIVSSVASVTNVQTFDEVKSLIPAVVPEAVVSKAEEPKKSKALPIAAGLAILAYFTTKD